MSKFASFDTDNQKRTSCGIVDMSCAFDAYPLVGIKDPTTGVWHADPTPHTWSDKTILLRPGLTISEIEEGLEVLRKLIHRRYGQLQSLLSADPSITDAGAIWRARMQFNLIK